MQILRYAAFTTDPTGGNPAGVVLDATGASAAEMQQVAAEVGYSETAFLVPTAEPGSFDVRYFSPLAAVPFCGHATIASAVAHAERTGPGPLRFATVAGPVDVSTTVDDGGTVAATLVSVPPRTVPLATADLDELLAALGWAAAELDRALPPRVAFAGAWHPVLGAGSRDRLAALDYDFPRLGALMAARDWTTVALVHRAGPTLFHARNPFPPVGSGRIRPPAPRPPRSAATCASSAWSRPRSRSPCTREPTWAGPACSPWPFRPSRDPGSRSPGRRSRSARRRPGPSGWRRARRARCRSPWPAASPLRR